MGRSDQRGGFYYSSAVVVKRPLWIPSGEVGKTFQRKSVNGATFFYFCTFTYKFSPKVQQMRHHADTQL